MQVSWRSTRSLVTGVRFLPPNSWSPGTGNRARGVRIVGGLLFVAVLTLYAGLTDSFPKVLGLLVGGSLLVYAIERAPEWIVAILLVGQFILHWISSFSGGTISRDNPLSGPLLPMYVLGACLVLARLLLAHRKQVRSARDFRWPLAVQLLVLTATLLGVLIAAGLLYSPAPMSARAKTLGYFAFNLAPSALVLLLFHSEERLVRLVKAVIVIGLLMAVFTHLGHDAAGGGGGLYNIGEGKQGLTIAGARFAGGTWFARRLDLVLISLLVLVALSRSGIYLTALLGAMPYIVYLLFLSGARGAAAGGAIAFMLVLTLLSVAAGSRRVLRIAAVTLLIVVCGLATSSVRDELLTREIVERYTILAHPFETEASGADRLQYWRTAWDIFQDHPLFGIGSGGWGWVWNKQDYRDFPHNIFLEVLCEQGLIGCLLFSLFFFGTIHLVGKVLRHPLSTRRGKILAIWAIGILTFAGMDAQLSGDIQTNDYIWMAAAIAAVLARICTAAERESRSADRLMDGATVSG
jgi:O-antigen ligase